MDNVSVAPSKARQAPDVVLIGAAKSGTSSLSRRLAEHPKIFLGPFKEPQFFSHDENFRRGLDWYADNFSSVEPDQLCLDASTAYTRSPQYPDAADRLYAHRPDARLIYLMRHPVERAYSHYVHRFTKELFPGKPIDRTFEEHIEADPVCVDSSNYKMQIEKYLAYFPRESMLFLFTHELHANPIGTVERVCRFLDIEFDEQHFDATERRRNVASKFRERRVQNHVAASVRSFPVLGRLVRLVPSGLKVSGFRLLRRFGLGREFEKKMTPAPMHESTRARLIEEFRPSNQWVSELTGVDLALWNE